MRAVRVSLAFSALSLLVVHAALLIGAAACSSGDSPATATASATLAPRPSPTPYPTPSAAVFTGDPRPTQDGVLVYLDATPEQPMSGFGTMTVRVMVRGVADLGGSVILLEVDSPDMHVINIDAGALLRSTGREVHCPEPAIWSLYARAWCFSIGSAPPGPSGDGELALVTLKPERAGEFRVRISGLELVDIESKPIKVLASIGGRISTR